jgi:hypothetical protein
MRAKENGSGGEGERATLEPVGVTAWAAGIIASMPCGLSCLEPQRAPPSPGSGKQAWASPWALEGLSSLHRTNRRSVHATKRNGSAVLVADEHSTGKSHAGVLGLGLQSSPTLPDYELSMPNGNAETPVERPVRSAHDLRGPERCTPPT